VEELQAVYARTDLTTQEKVQAREALLLATKEKYASLPDLEPNRRLVSNFLDAPLNNAVLMGRMLYFHRLPDFQALLEQHGNDLPSAIETLKRGVEHTEDPFQLLPDHPR
jgi:predicted aminopeptidase